jgi:hypothetical protein
MAAIISALTGAPDAPKKSRPRRLINTAAPRAPRQTCFRAASPQRRRRYANITRIAGTLRPHLEAGLDVSQTCGRYASRGGSLRLSASLRQAFAISLRT